MKQRNAVWILIISSLPLIAILMGTSHSDRDNRHDREAQNIDTAQSDAIARPVGATLSVKTGQAHWQAGYEIKRRYTGLVQSRKQSQLSYENGGTLLSLFVSDGERVSQNQKLAQLDQRWLNHQLNQAQANLNQQQAVLAEMIKGPRQEIIDAAQARLAESEAVFEDARIRFNRANSITGTGAIIEDELDRLRYRKVAAASVIDLRKAELRELKTGTRKEKIDAQKSLVASLVSRIEQIKVDLDKTVIRAPFSGQIGEIRLDIGTIASPGQAVMTIYENDLSSGGLEVWIGIPAHRELGMDIHKKTPWQIHINQSDWQAKLKAVLPQLNELNRTQTLILTLTAPSGHATASPPVGSLAAVDFTEKIETDGFWVPINALTKARRGLWSLYLVDELTDDFETYTRASRVDVEVLHQTENKAYIRGPVNEGAIFIADSTEKIVNRQHIDVTKSRGDR